MIPRNLEQETPLIARNDSTSIWNGVKYAPLGHAYNISGPSSTLKVVPISTQDNSSANFVDSHGTTNAEAAPYEPAQDPQNFQRVLNWTKETVGDFDPNELKPRRPVDKNERFDVESRVATTSTSQVSASLDEKTEELIPSFDDLMLSAHTIQSEVKENPAMTFDQLMDHSSQLGGPLATPLVPAPTSVAVGKVERERQNTPSAEDSQKSFLDLALGEIDIHRSTVGAESLEVVPQMGTLASSLDPPHGLGLGMTNPGPHIRGNHLRSRNARGRTGLGHGRMQLPSQTRFHQILSNTPNRGAQAGPSYAQAAVRGRAGPRGRGRAGNRGLQRQLVSRNPSLIDAGQSPTPQPPRAAHWDSRGLSRQDIISTDTASELNTGLNSEIPDVRRSGAMNVFDTQSDVGTSISQRMPNSPEYYVNTEVSRLNVASLKLAAIDRIAQNQNRPAARSEALQETDEVETRKIHNTMGQQAGKKAKNNAEETKRKKLEEAWGPMPRARIEKSITSQNSKPLQSTSSTRPFAQEYHRIMKRTDLTREQRLSDAELSKHASKIRNTILLPVFRSLRPFKAEIKFEVKIGQILSSLPSLKYYNHYHTEEEWVKVFAPSHNAFTPKSHFTNVLTNNGAEIDYILNLKHQNSDLLFEHEPFERRVTYEFQCQTRSSDRFVLRVTDEGDFTLLDPPKVISTTNLHFAANIWDACIVVAVDTSFVVNDTVKQAARELVESIHVGASERLSIVYQISKSNEIEVVAVNAKRTTLHHCLAPDHEDVALQITEVQRLKLLNHEIDTSLWLARSAKSDRILAIEGRLCHEISLSSSSVSSMLATNETIEMGLMNEAWEEKSLVTHRTINSLLAVTDVLIRRIDGVGGWNNGTAILQTEQGSIKRDDRTGDIGHMSRGRSQSGVDPVADLRSELGPDDSATAVGADVGTFAEAKAGRNDFW